MLGTVDPPGRESMLAVSGRVSECRTSAERAIGGFAGVLRVRLSLRDRVAGPAIRKEPRMATTEAEYLATWHEPSGTFPTRNGPGKWVTH